MQAKPSSRSAAAYRLGMLRADDDDEHAAVALDAVGDLDVEDADAELAGRGGRPRR